MSAFHSSKSFTPPPAPPLPPPPSRLQAAAHSSSCQSEVVLHGEAPMPLSNFTLQGSWAEHANPDITKQIKSCGWLQRRGRELGMLGRMGGGEQLSTWTGRPLISTR